MVRELGQGAQGVVYLAEDTLLRREVALKMLSSAGAASQQMRDRFQREAELTSKLDHPSICGVHEVGEADGLPYIAMQFVRGATLSSLLERAKSNAAPAKGGSGVRSLETVSLTGESKDGLQDVLRLVERVARALHAAHEVGVVHRDVKPGNVMVTPEGHPVVLDFGLARDVMNQGQTLTQSGEIVGTPAYLAPEQIVATRGQVGPPTDVYALGVTLFECLTLQRPFEATTWPQLFQAILNGAPPNPRALNPRIPRDLQTIVERAMERDPSRRYPSALELAEDLRRVRSFEPILARPAGPVVRARKWARRHPAAAMGIAAGLLVLLGAGTLWIARSISRRASFHSHLAEAETLLAALDFAAARDAIAQARQLAPDSAQVVELKGRIENAAERAQRDADERRAREAAAAARAEFRELQAAYASTREASEELRRAVLREYSGVFGRFASEDERAAFARKEIELRHLEVRVENLRFDQQAALDRAARLEAPWGGTSAETEAALADHYLVGWREAVAAGDTARSEALRLAVERHDAGGLHRAELLGHGTLLVTADPQDAELHLFRYESSETLDDPGAPRLVPVPSAGIGSATLAELGEFRPGRASLCVRAVAPGSWADAKKLRAGDLVVSIDGETCGDTLFLRAVNAGGALERSELRLGARVTELDGLPLERAYDWSAARASGGVHRVRVAGTPGEFACSLDELDAVTASVLLSLPAPVELRVACLQDGEIVSHVLPAGVSSGLTCDATANPLACASENRVEPGVPFEIEPGSYLLFARAPGREPQRIPIVVERRADARAHVELLPEHSTPPGFVYVPPGPFTLGGDPRAFQPTEAETRELSGFFIARSELSNGEWYEFVNDARTRARMATARPDTYLPRDDRVLARLAADGVNYEWDVVAGTGADTPVLGLAWTDARDFVEWRNQRAEERGERWRFELPSVEEWVKAARGADARDFPWGERFDPTLTTCLVRRADYMLAAASGSELRDESPYGVLDMAGSREEWLRDLVAGSDPPRYQKRGGHWGSLVEALFRISSRSEASQDRFAATQGLRLVARPR